jgi:hypothetical protein
MQFTKELAYSELKLKPFIYIADRKALAYSCRFFCSACFQLCSTTTDTLLLIRPPRRVTGWVNHRHLHTRTHIVVQDVMTYASDPACPRLVHYDVPMATSHENWLTSQHANHIPPQCTRVRHQCYNQRQGQTNYEVWRSAEGFSH